MAAIHQIVNRVVRRRVAARQPLLKSHKTATLEAAEVSKGRVLTFREFVEIVKPNYRWYRHCVVLCEVLQNVADGKIKRLMIFMPPRHGKSELASRLFSAYFLYRYPERWVAVSSYSAELAYSLSRAARENYLTAGGPMASNASAVKHWETGKGGGFWATGVGGPATGKGWHLGIIDDPIKNAKEAASEVIRQGQKEWYESTWYTREEPWSDTDPDGAEIVIQTRWNEDDLAGWQLAQEAEAAKDPDGDAEPEHWHIVCLPAIAEEPQEFPSTCTVEPDWREMGEALCPERRPIGKLKKLMQRIGEYFFGALFQQRPRPREGGMFKRDWFRIVPALPATRYVNGLETPITYRFVRYWDKAGTDGGGAYTAGVLMAAGDDGRYYVIDVVRGQWSAGERERMIRKTAEDDLATYGWGVVVWVEQEPGSGGKESAENTIINLAGFDAHKETVTGGGDKTTRAEPLAAQAEVLNVYLVRGEWNEPWLIEMTGFPTGKYKDQVDGSSGAFNKLSLGAVWTFG